MIQALKPLEPEPCRQEFTAQQNPAVAQCTEAWRRAFRSVLKKKNSEELAHLEAGAAYRMAMPPLVGYENISNFIACVGFGMLMVVFVDGEGTRLLYAAQVALNAGSTRKKKTKKQPQTGPNPSDSNALAA
jgi:hypothetical protein